MSVSVGACAKPAGRTEQATGAAPTGLTLQQFQERRERSLLAADTDGDERIARAEFLAAATGRRGDPARRFAALDRNADGMLDRAEIDAMAARRFRRIDADGDGVVSAGERAAVRTARRSAARSGAEG